MALNKAKDYKSMKGWDVDLEFGKHFEQVIDDIFSGVTQAEVKTERDKWVGYGNMVIETACSEKPSGLTSTTSDVWVHNFSYEGDLIFSIIVPVDRLRRTLEAMEEDGVIRHTKGGDGWRSQLSLVPLDKLLKYLRQGAKE